MPLAVSSRRAEDHLPNRVARHMDRVIWTGSLQGAPRSQEPPAVAAFMRLLPCLTDVMHPLDHLPPLFAE